MMCEIESSKEQVDAAIELVSAARTYIGLVRHYKAELPQGTLQQLKGVNLPEEIKSENTNEVIKNKRRTIVIFGPPASGKSTLSSLIFNNPKPPSHHLFLPSIQSIKSEEVEKSKSPRYLVNRKGGFDELEEITEKILIAHTKQYLSENSEINISRGGIIHSIIFRLARMGIFNNIREQDLGRLIDSLAELQKSDIPECTDIVFLDVSKEQSIKRMEKEALKEMEEKGLKNITEARAYLKRQKSYEVFDLVRKITIMTLARLPTNILYFRGDRKEVLPQQMPDNFVFTNDIYSELTGI